MNYVRGQLQQAPLQPQAEQMAQYGRYGDSMMVHMNPAEVQGIASLAPGGRLTTNPMTGQPEAFLPFLAPLLGSALGSAALTGVGAGTILGSAGMSSALAGAIGSGLTTAAITGDLKEGLVSGLTGFGIGKALGAGLDAAKGVKEFAGGVETAKEGVKIAGEAAAKAGQADALAQLGTGIGDASKTATDLASANTALSGAEDILASRSADYAQGVRDLGFSGRLGAMATNPGAVGKGLMSSSSLIPIAVGEGQRSQMDMMRRQEAAGRRFEAGEEAKAKRAEDLLATSLGRAGSDFGIDVSGADRRYAAYDPSNYANGGLVSLNPQEYQRQVAEAQMLGMQPIRMDMGGEVGGRFGNPNIKFGYGSAASRQAQLRGPVAKTAEELAEVSYRPGFGPEISYFRERLPDTDTTDTTTTDTTTPPVDVPFDPGMRDGIASMMTEGEYDDLIALATSNPRGMGRASKKYQQARKQYESLGLTGDKQEDMGVFEAPPNMRDLSFDYTEAYGMQEGGKAPTADPLLQQTMMAVLGRFPQEDSDVIIQRFLDEYGSEAFAMLRKQVLASVSDGQPQTEGEIKGEGGGMDDRVNGTIAGQAPVALSPGEYVVPADVVSSIGDGSTDSGVDKLDGMLDRVRTEKTGTTKQPAPLRSRGVLPA
jgi:hypothetical protein